MSTNSAGSYDLTNNNGFVAVGSFGSGNIPVDGAGTRLMWYPQKAAFRAGSISGTQWDDANIGLYSVAMGQDVRALGDYSLAGGARAVAANTGTFAFGEDVTATGANSVVLGYHASSSTSAGSPRQGTFVFGDRSTATNVNPLANNTATWRVSGGFYIYTSSTLTTGVNVTAGGGSWNTVSDRNRKQNFLAVDGEDLLARLRNVPVTTWNYIAEGRQVRHMGPMAQDWHQAFGFSADSLTINTGDIDGVNLAAVKALEARTAAQQARIDALETENAELRRRLDRIEAMVAAPRR
ncbi:MAG TPA: tail fiber domain-containing protein [Longimicrobium sp.]